MQDIKRNMRKIILTGSAEEAAISKLSIFPDFPTWFRENIYLIPLTLISTIFGGVAIIKKK